MKHTKFKIIFTNPNVPDLIISALNANEAKILAQADRIKQGLDYEVFEVINTENKRTIRNGKEYTIYKH